MNRPAFPADGPGTSPGARAVDRGLADTLRRLDPATDDAVLQGAELASLAVGAGHAALDLRQAARLAPADAVPAVAAWRASLRRSRWVAAPGPHEPAPGDRPLVLEGDLLYLRRYREYERRLALGLHRIAAGGRGHDAVATGERGHDDNAANAPGNGYGARTSESDGARVPARGGDGRNDRARVEPRTSSIVRGRGVATADAASPDGVLPALAPLFARLFPDAGTGDDQARAAALALVRRLLLITGGPGTGKTTTLARLLVLLIAEHRLSSAADPAADPAAASLRIALAAPTGRAAERMAQSMVQARDALRAAGVDAGLLDALPTQARTLHRLLGTIPDRPQFRHDAAHPLAHDVVVVDEASMVDLPLMCKLVEAVPEGATLVLVGDPDQLPSVEAGDVLASIVRAAGEGDRLPPDVEAALAPLLGGASQARSRSHPRAREQAPGAQSGRRPAAQGRAERTDPWTLPLFEEAATAPAAVPALPAAPTLIAGHRVHLRRAWRQTEALDLAPLADAVRTGQAERALAALHAQSLRGVHFHPGAHDLLATELRETLLAPWRALAACDDPAQALAMAARVRLLTALREGPSGAVQLNARIEEALAGVRREPYFHGRLLLVTENSYRHGLFNGDIGVCLRDPGGASVVWFASGSGPGPGPGGERGQAVRGFHPGALPAHEGAFAMTVHKAQGSEFDTVWFLLPARDNRVLSRELVYTALTRARRELHLAGNAEVIEAALGRHVARWSGLGWRLAQPR